QKVVDPAERAKIMEQVLGLVQEEMLDEQPSAQQLLSEVTQALTKVWSAPDGGSLADLDAKVRRFAAAVEEEPTTQGRLWAKLLQADLKVAGYLIADGVGRSAEGMVGPDEAEQLLSALAGGR